MYGLFQKKKNVSLYFLFLLVQEDKKDSLLTPAPNYYKIKDLSKKGPSWKISEAKRITNTIKSYTDKCPAYKFKSYIGEGPKYSISAKFNMDGTTYGKRHPKAYINPPVPGPGFYNINRNLGGLQYSIGERREKKKLNKNKSCEFPGVGAYNLRKDNSLDVPCCKFDHSKRDNLNMNLSAIKNPGPGNYKWDNDANSTCVPKWSFSKCERFERLIPKNPKMERFIVPGPGSYSKNTIIGNEGPHYSFNKEQYNHSDSVDISMQKKTQNYPSPVTYKESIAYVTDMPQ